MIRSDGLWRFACGNVSFNFFDPFFFQNVGCSSSTDCNNGVWERGGRSGAIITSPLLLSNPPNPPTNTTLARLVTEEQSLNFKPVEKTKPEKGDSHFYTKLSPTNPSHHYFGLIETIWPSIVNDKWSTLNQCPFPLGQPSLGQGGRISSLGFHPDFLSTHPTNHLLVLPTFHCSFPMDGERPKGINLSLSAADTITKILLLLL